MKKSFFLLLIVFVSCKSDKENLISDKEAVNATVNAWHKAAADVKYDAYFDFMTEDATFMGTDATENWNTTAFKAFAKPYFDRGSAWDFTVLERHIYFDTTRKTAWFDELLNTQMKICRGSGVLVKIGKEWKVKHYVLSMTIPNEKIKEVIKVKESIEDVLIKKLQTTK